MKRKDVKAGVVYAYQASKYDRLRPVLVLDAAYWRRRSSRFGADKSARPTFESHAEILRENVEAGRTWKPDDRYAGGDIYPDCGLLVLDRLPEQRRGADLNAASTDARRLAALAAKSGLPALVEQVRALTGGTARLGDPEGPLRVHLVNPSWIVGGWEEVVTDALDEEERRRGVEAEAKAGSEDRVARASKRVEALRALGLPGEIADAKETTTYRLGSRDWAPPRYTGNTDHVRLSMRQVDALLSLIPDGARWAPDDVEEDGWTLRKPEYEEADPDAEADD